ncbi:MAG: single-stranded DNA-binding protein, partial [Acidimicrobiia bacterium]|nr:single-stranded DNA-binding protein [Acidimicrobiia bacterium]
MITATAVGRLTDTPNLRYLDDGTPVANFSLATDNRNREDTTFLRVAIWGKAAEAAAEHLVKGQRIAASGRIESQSWTDDEGTAPPGLDSDCRCHGVAEQAPLIGVGSLRASQHFSSR